MPLHKYVNVCSFVCHLFALLQRLHTWRAGKGGLENQLCSDLEDHDLNRALVLKLVGVLNVDSSDQ